jgi:selenocysteine lyase/cysteine desulfurase
LLSANYPRARGSWHWLRATTSGWRNDVDAIGESLHKRGVHFQWMLFRLLLFPFQRKICDFLSADAHKWMLGPMAIGIVYVARQHFELCRPTLLDRGISIRPNSSPRRRLSFTKPRSYEPEF